MLVLHRICLAWRCDVSHGFLPSLSGLYLKMKRYMEGYCQVERNAE